MSKSFKYNRLSKDDAALLLGRPPGGPDLTGSGLFAERVQEQRAGCRRLRQVLQVADHSHHQLRERPERAAGAGTERDVPERARTSHGPATSTPGTTRTFVNAIKKTGRKQLIIAGVVTEVCVAFPALSAIEEGYEVFVITDASGTFNEVTRHSAWLRMQAAGVQLMNWFGMACELHRDWRNDIEGLGTLFSNHIPNYRNLMTSYFTLADKK